MRDTDTDCNHYTPKNHLRSSDKPPLLEHPDRNDRCLEGQRIGFRVIMRTVVFSAFLWGCLSGCATSPQEAYQNPVDRTTYVASGGWKTYEPQSGTPKTDPGKKVNIDLIRLLTAQDDIAKRTTAEEIASCVKEVEKVAEPILAKSAKPYQLLVQFNCTPAKDAVKMSYQGEADKKALQILSEALKKVKKLPVKSDEVSFQIQFTITP